MKLSVRKRAISLSVVLVLCIRGYGCGVCVEYTMWQDIPCTRRHSLERNMSHSYSRHRHCTDTMSVVACTSEQRSSGRVWNFGDIRTALGHEPESVCTTNCSIRPECRDYPALISKDIIVHIYGVVVPSRHVFTGFKSVLNWTLANKAVRCRARLIILPTSDACS
jgi:hypothetical protein